MHRQNKLRVLGAGTSITFQGLWEFIPYNDADTKPADLDSFAQKAEELAAKMLEPEDGRFTALKDLKTLYKDEYVRGKKFNDASLMLYSGATRRRKATRCIDCEIAEFGHPCYQCHDMFGFPNRNESKGSILLTGDGTLKTAAKWDKLQTYLHPQRAIGCDVFQVPHHGSKANWYNGLADEVGTDIPVFSSDPSHDYGHPHAEVLRDFWPYQPKQVDRNKGLSVIFEFEW